MKIGSIFFALALLIPVTLPAHADLITPGVTEIDGTFTPTDASGAALTFTAPSGFYRKIGKTVFVWGIVTYPSTADASQAGLGALPFTPSNSGTNQVGTLLCISASTVTDLGWVVSKNLNTARAAHLAANTAVANSVFSTATVIFFGSYPTDQ